MKKTILTIATVVVATVTITTSCNTSQKKVENAQENVADAAIDLDKANEEYMAEVASYRIATQEKIDANNVSINEFKTRIASEKKEVRADYNEKITALELKNTDAKKRMDDYKEDGKDKWESFKREFNHDMDELSQSLKDFTVNNKK